MSKTVDLTIADGIATVRLNRPDRLNAINDALLADLSTALRHATTEPEVAVILLHGAGRAFCAGYDLKDSDLKDSSLNATDEREAHASIDNIQQITHLLTEADAIVIAAVHGWAVGGGIEWALACDLVVAGEGTRAFFPEASLGLFVTGGASGLLPRIVGPHRAKEMLLLGEEYDAATLHALGLCNRVVPDDEVMATTRELAQRIADLPPIARMRTKHVIGRAMYERLEQTMQRETEATVEGLLDPESRQRVATRMGV